MKSIKIIIIFLCILLYGCKKEPDNTVKPPNNPKDTTEKPPYNQKDTSFVDDILKQNYLFNPGSKWIYRSNKSEIDTVHLTSLKQHFIGPMYVHGMYSGCCEEYYFAHYKSNIKDSFVDVYNGQLIMRNPTYSFSGYKANFILIDWFKTGDSACGIKLSEIIDSVTLFGKTYHNVYKIQKFGDENEKNSNTIYYFAPHYGIIRKEVINDSVTWDLYESDIK